MHSLHATFIVCVGMQDTASFVIHSVVCGANFATRSECASNDVMRHWRLYSLTKEGRIKGCIADCFSFECIVLLSVMQFSHQNGTAPVLRVHVVV